MYFIIDLEATCWERRNVRDRNEIIEIGIVVCQYDGSVEKTYQSFVKPKVNPILSSFCRNLTNIKQDSVDKASPLIEVLSFMIGEIETEFSIQAQKTIWFSFGDWDNICLRRDCERNNIMSPFGKYVDMKMLYTEYGGCNNCGLKDALYREGIKWKGDHHRALDDAINAASLAPLLITQEFLDSIV